MKKPSSKIREDIRRLQEQLRQAETREAERLGRFALRAGLGEIQVKDSDLLKALEEITARFRKVHGRNSRQTGAPVPAGMPSGSSGEG
jgi:hypothetical protein